MIVPHLSCPVNGCGWHDITRAAFEEHVAAVHPSSPEDPGMLPALDLADRMRKALRFSGIGVSEMAGYLGVDRSTVSTWINGRIIPRKPVLILFAGKTGVPFEWLLHGAQSHAERS